MFVVLKFIEEFNGVPKNVVLPLGEKLASERNFDARKIPETGRPVF